MITSFLPRRPFAALLLGVVAAFAFVGSTSAAVATKKNATLTDTKLFLKLDGIKGESVAKGFEEQIELLSFAWGGANASAEYGPGGSAGRPEIQGLSLNKYFDRTSPQILALMLKGRFVREAKLSVVQEFSDGTTHKQMEITLTEATVVSSDVGHTAWSENKQMVESHTLQFRKLELTHFAPNGTATTVVYDAFERTKQ